MPHGFEYIVRPFGSPDSLRTTVIPATPKGTRERAHLTWGGKGTMPQVRLTGVDFATQKPKPKDETLTENDRESDIIRIEQPGKPENYVDVARAKKVKLEKVTEGDLDRLADTQYAASGLDPRLEGYSPNMSGSQETFKTKAVWNMKNQS
jgi:hypothetical protein